MKIIVPVLLLMLLASCTKESVTAPKPANQTIVASTAVAYKDNNISVVNFKAQDNGKVISVGFTTLYEKNIAKLEILRGFTSANLCSIYRQDVQADSYAAIQYSTSDTDENKTPELYYMVKYTLANGDWGYTPVFKLTL